MNLKYIILLFLVFCVACERYEQQGGELAYMESWNVDFGLASGNCVVHDDTLYVLFGREDGGSAEEPSKMWRCAPMSDLSDWQEVEMPLAPRVSATAIAVGDKLYAGLGFCGKVYNKTSLLRDWWEYDFASKEWTQLADFPTKDVVAPVVWLDEGYIYAALGFAENFSKNVYRYDISDDRWEQVDKLEELLVRADAVGVRVEDCVYFGLGYGIEMKNDWWRYDWTKKELLKCGKMPGRGRVFASAVAVDDNVYVLGGRYFGGTETREHFYETIIFYNTANDAWHTLGRMEQAAENMIAFEYNGDLFWGLGQREDGEFVKKIYRREMK